MLPVVAATFPTDRSARRDAVSVLSITVRRPVISLAIGWNDIGSGAGARCTLLASCCKNRSGSGVGSGVTTERGATAVIGVAESDVECEVEVLEMAVLDVAVFATEGEPFEVWLGISAEDLATASGLDGPRPATPATLRCTLRSDESAGSVDVDVDVDVDVAAIAAVGCNERCAADVVAGCIDGSRSARTSAPVPAGTTMDRAVATPGLAGASVGRERLASSLRWTVDDSAGPAAAALCCVGVRRVSMSVKCPVPGAVSVRRDAAEGCGVVTRDCGVLTPDRGAALNC